MTSEKTATINSLVFNLASIKYLLNKFPGAVSYQKFTLAHTASCANLLINAGDIVYMVSKIPYTLQPEYEAGGQEIKTTNYILARIEGSSTDYLHFMICRSKDDLCIKIKGFAGVVDGPRKPVPVENISHGDIIGTTRQFLSATLSKDHKVANYQRIFGDLVNDEHMLSVYEEEGISSIDLTEFMAEAE